MSIIEQCKNIYKVNYKCTDKSGSIYLYEHKLKKNNYFKTLVELSDKKELNLEFSFCEKSLGYVISILYDKGYTCVDNIESFVDIIKAISFFCMDECLETILHICLTNCSIVTEDNFTILYDVFITYGIDTGYYKYLIFTFWDNLDNTTKNEQLIHLSDLEKELINNRLNIINFENESKIDYEGPLNKFNLYNKVDTSYYYLPKKYSAEKYTNYNVEFYFFHFGSTSELVVNKKIRIHESERYSNVSAIFKYQEITNSNLVYARVAHKSSN